MKKIFVKFFNFETREAQSIILNCTEDEIKTLKRFSCLINGCIDADVIPTQIEISDIDNFDEEYTLSDF